MKKYFLTFFALCITIIIFSDVADARQKPKPWSDGWWQYEQNFSAVVPDKSGAKHFHPKQWKARPITMPYEERQRTIDSLVAHDFLDKVTANAHVATVWTGPNFNDLSQPNQTYIMDIIGLHYDIPGEIYQMLVVRDAVTHNFLGSYTKYGWQIE